MNPIAIIGIVSAVIDLVQRFLPMVTKSDTTSIDKIIDAVQAIAPLAIDQVAVTYTGVKNILSAIGSHPATIAEQLASLKVFNDQIDAAWNEIEKQLDPDA